MKATYSYIYYHFYIIAKWGNKRNASSGTGKGAGAAARTYISIILAMLSLPAPDFIIIKLFNKDSIAPYVIIFGIFGIMVNYLNGKLVKSIIDLPLLQRKYQNENNYQKVLGCASALILLFSSPVIGFYILSFF